MNREQFLAHVKINLRDVYGNRLRGVILYGSEARGEATWESDLDLLVLLKGPVALGRDLEIIVRALYPLQLEILRPFHVTPVDIDVYESGEFALYRNAREEGVLA